MHALLIAQATMNSEMDKQFTLDYIKHRLSIIHKRYRTFYWVKRKHGVRFDEATNTVTAPDYVWDDIIKKDEFGLAYQEMGDPDWTDLQQLFGEYHENLIPLDAKIIEISSDSESEGFVDVAELPKPKRERNITKTTSSWPSADRSFWNYLAQFEPQTQASSEISVNQMIKPTGPHDYPGPSFYRRPSSPHPPPS
ncbi:hypothetical protein DH2020_022575 [Rehmannia glutinosa]|uniref:Myb/SANT-like domain-containing protein n=1 Tax=Rehmannia glutinosa TaxID=99300 RepID=A0ABR0W7G1_REHGL